MEIEKKYYTVQDSETLKLMFQHITDSKVIAVDTETSGLNPRKDKIVGWSISGDEGIGFYIPTLVWDFSKEELVLQTIDGTSTETISKNLLKALKGKKHGGIRGLAFNRRANRIDEFHIPKGCFPDNISVSYRKDSNEVFGKYKDNLVNSYIWK